MLRKWIAILLAVAMVLIVGGCGAPAEPAGEEPQTTTSTTTTTTASTTTTTAAPTKQFNIVTGEYDIPLNASTRPVGIMIANDSWAARPQAGLETADLFVEIETEGAITRILAIFGSSERVPALLAPVRSARSPFVQIAQALDLVYLHAGGSVPAKATLSKIDIDHLDSAACWREESLWNERDYEHSLSTGGKKLTEYLADRSWETTPTRDMPYAFGEIKGNAAGKVAQVKISASETATFRYDDTSGLYTKYLGSTASDELHETLDGKITVSNVIVLYGDKYGESATNGATCNFDLANGNGKLITGGTARDITYTVTADAFKLYETDGSIASVATGKTYICIADTAYAEALKLS